MKLLSSIIFRICLTAIVVCITGLCNSFTVEAQNAPITTAAAIVNAIPGQTVTVPVTVSGFSNIGSFTLRLYYDYSKIHYVSGSQNPSLGGTFSIGDKDLMNGTHRLTISWFGGGATLPSGSYITNLQFTYLSGTANLEWIDNGPSCSYSDNNAILLNDSPTSTYYINGLITQSIIVNAKVYIEGAYSGGNMSTSLRSMGLLPLNQPYNAGPWNYAGGEQVTSIPANITDWVLVELRTQPAATSTVATRAGFLRNDGMIVDMNGTDLLRFDGLSNGNYYIVIRHRNHIPVMSSVPVSLSAVSSLYNFSTGTNQFYGGINGAKLIDPGVPVWGMITGDGSNEGSIYLNDYTDYWVSSFGLNNVYNTSDFNLNGSVFLDDYTDFWVPNFGRINLLP